MKHSLAALLVLPAVACHGIVVRGTRGAEPADVFSAEAPSAAAVRPARFAGSWYPSDPTTLRQQIDTRLARYPSPAGQPPVIALVGPHAGLPYSGGIAAAAYASLLHQRVERVFLLGPSHEVAFRGVALPPRGMRAYATPLGQLTIDQRTVEALRRAPGFSGPPKAQLPEHSLEMHAIFIARVAPHALLVPLVVGTLGSPKQVDQIAATLRAQLHPGDVVAVSSDFTHYGPRYGYVPFTKNVPARLDALLNDAAAAVAGRRRAAFVHHLQTTGDTICGREPIRILLAMLPKDSQGRRIADTSSGKETGDFSASVSYQAIVFRRAGGWPAGSAKQAVAAPAAKSTTVLNPTQQTLALHLVQQTLAAYLRHRHRPTAAELEVPMTPPWSTRRGTFVTLTESGALRGCIGHILPVEPLWRDLRDNAISAAVEDPRFPPVTASELALLSIEVSILTVPQQIAKPQAVVLGRDGVVLTDRGRRAVYLPQVATEQHWGLAPLLNHLARKAGLPMDAWREPSAHFSVFEAQVFPATP